MKRSRHSIRPSIPHEKMSQASFYSHSRVGMCHKVQASSNAAILRGEVLLKSITVRDRRCLHTRDDDEMVTNVQVDNRSLESRCEGREIIQKSLVLPPAQPNPVYSVHMRVLPSSLIAMSC